MNNIDLRKKLILNEISSIKSEIGKNQEFIKLFTNKNNDLIDQLGKKFNDLELIHSQFSDEQLISEKIVLTAYKRGFNDSLNNLNIAHIIVKKYRPYYKIGQAHAIAGDDVKNLDLQSDEDILKDILKQK